MDKLVVAHTSYNNYDDKYPKDHIKIEIAAVASLTAFIHDEPPFPDFNIYYDECAFFEYCPKKFGVFGLSRYSNYKLSLKF